MNHFWITYPEKRNLMEKFALSVNDESADFEA